MAETVAIGDLATGKVSLWCEETRATETGYVFEVLNGAWEGTYDRDAGTVYVHYTKRTFPARELWRGVVPALHNGDYNTAMAWIQAQVAKETTP